jgi:hypothetical protein
MLQLKNNNLKKDLILMRFVYLPLILYSNYDNRKRISSYSKTKMVTRKITRWTKIY